MNLSSSFHFGYPPDSWLRCPNPITTLIFYRFRGLLPLFRVFYLFWMCPHSWNHLPRNTPRDLISCRLRTIPHKCLCFHLKISKSPCRYASRSWIGLHRWSHLTRNRILCREIYPKDTLHGTCLQFWSTRCRCRFWVLFRRCPHRTQSSWGRVDQNHLFCCLSTPHRRWGLTRRSVCLSRVYSRLKIDRDRWFPYSSCCRPWGFRSRSFCFGWIAPCRWIFPIGTRHLPLISILNRSWRTSTLRSRPSLRSAKLCCFQNRCRSTCNFCIFWLGAPSARPLACWPWRERRANCPFIWVLPRWCRRWGIWWPKEPRGSTHSPIDKYSYFLSIFCLFFLLPQCRCYRESGAHCQGRIIAFSKIIPNLPSRRFRREECCWSSCPYGQI